MIMLKCKKTHPFTKMLHSCDLIIIFSHKNVLQTYFKDKYIRVLAQP